MARTSILPAERIEKAILVIRGQSDASASAMIDDSAAGKLVFKRAVAPALVDLDGDGFPDLICDDRIYKNDPGKRFIDVTKESGVRGSGKSLFLRARRAGSVGDGKRPCTRSVACASG